MAWEFLFLLNLFQLFCFPKFCFCVSIDLGGKWTIHNANRSLYFNGNVPGSVHIALLNNGTIADPYFRFNDVNYRWIAYDNWTYSRDFEVSEEMASMKKIVLVCDGLDTVATVTINGVVVGKSVNMFHQYIFDVKEAIKVGTNAIDVSFTSAISYAANKSRAYGYKVPPECSVPVQRGECHRNFIRKEQCSFSWDWGPAFAPQGIWRNITVEAYNLAVIRQVTTTPTRVHQPKDQWVLDFGVFIDATSDGVTGSLSVSIKELGLLKQYHISLSKGFEKIKLPPITFEADQIKAWWPRGYGDQQLYNVEVQFLDSRFAFQTGFRTVTLVQEPIAGSEGLGFHFEINGLPMFLKGANWIPVDSFEDRVSADVLRNLLQSVADANMNVVRNWGGGIYQHDDFYTIADELGILVWEELMFACSMYPVDKEFLSSVEEEVKYQVRRLHNHPSVFVWGGNNENEVALAQNWYKTDPQKKLYVGDYVKLYIDTIRKIFEEEESSSPFFPSSPSNGVETEKEGWVAKNPGNPLYGDVHFYNYNMDCWNVSGYPKPRFASEYGFQSYPSFETLSKVSVAEDWNYSSKFMDHRQHHGNGNRELLQEIQSHFKLPSSENLLKRYQDTLFLTQVMQALCMKVETEHYRRLQSELIRGQGKTMGAIYWQLNSIWQAPTWSSLEYGGKWKMLHYYAKNFFSPVIASVYEDDGNLKVYVVSDLVKPIQNGLLCITMWTWASFKPLFQWTKPFVLKSQSSQLVFKEAMTNLLNESQCENRNQCVLTVRPLEQKTEEALGPSNTFYLAKLSDAVGMKDPHLQITSVKQFAKRQFALLVEAQSPAAFVWLKAGNIPGRFSENGYLQTQKSKKVLFYSWMDISASKLSKSLQITSLYSVYDN